MKRMSVAVAVLLLGLLSTWLSPPPVARAQTESAYDLINTVNALRTSLGLAAYTIDPWLMTYSQQHVDYIDSLNMRHAYPQRRHPALGQRHPGERRWWKHGLRHRLCCGPPDMGG